jgi:hypothetical protein
MQLIFSLFDVGINLFDYLIWSESHFFHAKVKELIRTFRKPIFGLVLCNFSPLDNKAQFFTLLNDL